MPITDISKIHSKVFGICCLEGEERDHVYAQWKARFSERTAFFVEVNPEYSGGQIVQAICDKITAQNIPSVAGEQCIITMFFDLRKPINDDFRATLWNISSVLGNVLNCNILLVLQFGYVGTLGLSSAEIQRENTKKIVSSNTGKSAAVQYRLCLVGSPVLAAAGGNNWKSVMVFLDTLRRLPSATNLLPQTADGDANNDVGFLRYGEYNKSQYDDLVREKEKLLELRGSGGAALLKEQLDQKRNAISNTIKEKFSIRATLQPQHTNMIVEPGFLGGNRRAAQRGNNKAYTTAQQETRAAILLTGKRLKDDIKKLFDLEINSARRTLDDLFEKATVGIDLRSDKITMQSLLMSNEHRISEPPLPALLYREDGCVEEIDAYLTGVKSHAVSLGMNRFDEAIIQAYEEILAEGFQEEKERIQDRLDFVSAKISALNTAEYFCERIAFTANPPESDFNPIGAPGAGLKYLLFRGDEMRAVVSGTATNSSIPVYEIRETGSGLQTLDSAPLKAVQIVFLDCTETALKELMPEVNI